MRGGMFLRKLPRMVRILIATALVAVAVQPASAQRRDQDDAFAAARSGEIRPLGEIIGRVNGRVRGGSFIGSDFDAGTKTYRLKYMRGGEVVVVDVDARSGRILSMTGE
jgi:uncharacterized membrane protein YkoI